jgi:hypothetical protein
MLCGAIAKKFQAMLHRLSKTKAHYLYIFAYFAAMKLKYRALGSSHLTTQEK